MSDQSRIKLALDPMKSILPEFSPITAQSFNALYDALLKRHIGANDADKIALRKETIRVLEAEQERVTRIHEAYYGSAPGMHTPPILFAGNDMGGDEK